MNMHPGKPCRHLEDGLCSIYATRPQNPCRDFDCGWKMVGSPMPDDMRPDRCGAIVILGQDWRHWKVIRAVPAGWTIPDATLKRIKHFAVSNKMALIYHEFKHQGGVLTQTDRLGFGPPDFIEAFQQAMRKEGATEIEPPRLA